MIAEACFSNSGGGRRRVALPGWRRNPNRSGLCQPDDRQCINGSSNLCAHGTHVAGEAAGLNTSQSTGEPTNGVAQNANVFAIQIFTRINSSAICSPDPAPCIGAWTSDQISALDYVFSNLTLPGGVKVASVN